MSSSEAIARDHARVVFTVGHSTHAFDDFLALLARHGITAIADVCSSPYSRMNPQFNREVLEKALADAGIAYVFLGEEIGARSNDPDCYEHGKVRYERLARIGAFRRGLDRVFKGAEDHRLALMCAEKEPLDCHRANWWRATWSSRAWPYSTSWPTARWSRTTTPSSA